MAVRLQDIRAEVDQPDGTYVVVIDFDENGSGTAYVRGPDGEVHDQAVLLSNVAHRGIDAAVQHVCGVATAA